MKQTQLRNLIVAGTIAMAPVVGAVIHLTSATEPGFSSEPLRQTAADLAPAPASAHRTTANVPVTTDARIYGVLYGNNKFESSWICSIPVAGSPELQKHQGSVYCTYGGVYIDGYYYASNSNEIQKYDPQDWSAGKISATAIDKDTAFRPVELTYDVTTETVWGAFLQPNSWTDKYFLGTIDLETGKATSLRMLDEGLVCEGMAADAHGNIYTIINKDFTEYWGNLPTLYKLDKKTGELTKIATYSTELPLGKACSATIDFATGKLYWMTDTYPLATLYEIDVTTGERTVVYRMPDNDRVVSIYIPYEITEDDAPALLNDLALTFTDTDGNATVTFTVPDKTHNGAALTSSVTYDITEGRTSLSTGSLTPGATASIPVKVSAKGVVKLNVALTANAKTSASREVINQLYPALRQAVKGKNQFQAVNMLLKLAQTFPYGYDDKIWGHDRAFWMDESWQYPLSDCEDHAVNFTRMVRDILGLDAVLIYYPGHLSAAVAFTEGQPNGDYVVYGGRRYTVCDATCQYGPIGYSGKYDNSQAILIPLTR